jgi:hypothetical protein
MRHILVTSFLSLKVEKLKTGEKTNLRNSKLEMQIRNRSIRIIPKRKEQLDPVRLRARRPSSEQVDLDGGVVDCDPVLGRQAR